MKDNSSTKVESSTDATIAAIPCYAPCGLELNKIYNESNLDTMKRMPDNFVDLTVTSPPYDNLRDYKGYSFPQIITRRYRDWETDRKSTRLNSSHSGESRMPSAA